MNGRQVASGFVVVLMFALAACGGNPPPEPEPQPEPAPTASDEESREDSLARARARERQREREASQLCQRAEAAMQQGDYERARRLFQRAVEEFGGTGCAERAGRALDAVDAVEAVKQRIHFEFDKSDITDRAAEVLQRKAEVLRNFSEWEVTIEGHCDERGSLEYNQALGMRRAQAAKQYLVSLGLDADRFETVSYGEERPLVQASNESAWAMNRRDEFVIDNPGAVATR